MERNQPRKRTGKRVKEAWQAERRDDLGLTERSVNEAEWGKLYGDYLQDGRHKKKRRPTAVQHSGEAQTEATVSPGLSLAEFITWMTLHSKNQDILSPLYNESDIPMQILASRFANGKQQCQVKWQNTHIRKSHLPLYRKIKYVPVSVKPLPHMTDEEWVEAEWPPTWEPFDPENQDQTLCQMMRAFLEDRDNLAAGTQQPRPRPPRKDGKLPNNKRQGHFIPPDKRPKQPMLHDPKLAQYITLDTTRRDPDWDQ